MGYKNRKWTLQTKDEMPAPHLEPLPVTAVHVGTIYGRLVVDIEVNGQWRRALSWPVDSEEFISAYVETPGLHNAPVIDIVPDENSPSTSY